MLFAHFFQQTAKCTQIISDPAVAYAPTNQQVAIVLSPIQCGIVAETALVYASRKLSGGHTTFRREFGHFFLHGISG
jgi:hypothetical protein